MQFRYIFINLELIPVPNLRENLEKLRDKARARGFQHKRMRINCIADFSENLIKSLCKSATSGVAERMLHHRATALIRSYLLIIYSERKPSNVPCRLLRPGKRIRPWKERKGGKWSRIFRSLPRASF